MFINVLSKFIEAILISRRKFLTLISKLVTPDYDRSGQRYLEISTNEVRRSLISLVLMHKSDPPALLPFLPPFLIFGAYKATSSLDILEPVERGFFRNDQSIQHPLGDDRIPHIYVLLVGALVPPICITISRRGDNMKRIFTEVCIYLFGFLMALVCTDILKVYAGRLRPDFIERCKPDYSKVADPEDLNAFIVEDVCTGVRHEILNGRKSHPSGHAMGAAFAAVYLMTLWLQRVRRNSINSGVNTLVLTVLAYYPVVVATSRVSDYKHHPLDVFVGCILGCAFALYTAFYLNGWVGSKCSAESPTGGGMLGGDSADKGTELKTLAPAHSFSDSTTTTLEGDSFSSMRV